MANKQLLSRLRGRLVGKSTTKTNIAGSKDINSTKKCKNFKI